MANLINKINRNIAKIVERFGYKITRKGEFLRYWSKISADYISNIANPNTVIDVGVGDGTPELYSAFSKSRLILIEPLISDQVLQNIKNKYDAFAIKKALGARSGEKEIIVDKRDSEKSSFRKRKDIAKSKNPKDTKKVEVTTLDHIYENYHKEIEKPIFLKIDTEGYELEVLDGAKELLTETKTVLIEVSVADRFDGGYGFEELISRMDHAGFRLFDIISLHNIEGGPGTKFLDAVFRKR